MPSTQYKVNLDGAPFHCGWIDSTPVVLGGTALYTVSRSSAGAGVWRANLNGVQRLQVDVNFSSAHRILASGELVRDSGVPDGTVDACYACAGSNSWARTSVADPGTADWTTIQSAQNINTDGQWSIDPLPGPFGVHHTLYDRRGRRMTTKQARSQGLSLLGGAVAPLVLVALVAAATGGGSRGIGVTGGPQPALKAVGGTRAQDELLDAIVGAISGSMISQIDIGSPPEGFEGGGSWVSATVQARDHAASVRAQWQALVAVGLFRI